MQQSYKIELNWIRTCQENNFHFYLSNTTVTFPFDQGLQEKASIIMLASAMDGLTVRSALYDPLNS